MKPRTKHIKGSLWPSNAYALTEITPSKIRKAITANNLTTLVRKERWGFGIIDINSVTIVSRDFSDINEFLSSLESFLRDEQVADLGLHGELRIAVETATVEPIMYRIIVSKGEVFMQRGAIVWT